MNLFRKKNILASLNAKPLSRCLSAFDLTLLGIGAIVGAGIFVITGVVAATHTGPAIILSFLVAGFACGCAALSYAELAAAIGGCGSAYGYAYAGFGELIAWIVGWDLLLEYSLSVSAVSVGWGGYFNDLLLAMHVHIPTAWLTSPLRGGILDVLSLAIVMLISGLLMTGAKSSVRVNNIIVCVKLAVIFMFICIASTQFKAHNWVPFLPFGWHGVMSGASLIFFAYIGFDAVSTAAEEVTNPQRNLPRGIIGSLVICTVLYILVSGLLTGMVPYVDLNVASPISHALILLGYHTSAGIVGVGALAGLTTVILVLFYGLSRIFLAMARDGLLPPYFAVINTRTQTPIRIILPCGVFIAITSALLPLNDLAELVNVGTLFAFATVCGGVLVLRVTQPDLVRPFKTPFTPYVPLLGIISCLYLMANLPWFTLMRFIVWLLVGFVIYFSYSRKNSVLSRAPLNEGDGV